MSADFDQAVSTARSANMLGVRTPQDYVIHDVPEWGPAGGHYAPGYRVYPAAEQAPGGLLPTWPRAGVPVATVHADGTVSMIQDLEVSA